MRILVWHYDPYPTAPGVLIGELPRRGHEVVWVTTSPGDDRRVEEHTEGSVRFVEIRRGRDSSAPRPIAIVVNRLRKLAGVIDKVRVMSRLTAEKPDLLQIRELVTEGWIGLWYARRRGIPFVYQFDHPHFEAQLHLLHQQRRAAPFLRWKLQILIHLRDYLVRSADLVLPISAAMAERIERRNGVPSARIAVFPVGISRRHHESVFAERPRAAVDLDPDRPTVCYMGSLSPRRNPAMIFEILEAILRRSPEVQFLLVGERNDAVDRELHRFSRPERLHPTGRLPHDEVPRVLRGAQVGIFPLPMDDPHDIYRTSSPLKVVEYLASGVPVVSSPVPDAAGILEASRSGECVPYQADAFAEAVQRYIEDPAGARAAGRRGQRYVFEHRSFEVLARQLEGAYERLLRGTSPATGTRRSGRRGGEERWAS